MMAAGEHQDMKWSCLSYVGLVSSLKCRNDALLDKWAGSE